MADPQHVRDVLLSQVEEVAMRVRRNALFSRTVTLKIRFGAFQTITRSATLDAPTDSTQILWEASAKLFDDWTAASFQPVRLIGMTAKELSRTEGQLTLFPDPGQQKQRKLDQALDTINSRFGKTTIRRGGA